MASMVKTRCVSPTHVHPSSSPTQHKWLVSLAVMLGATLEVLDSSIVNVSLPHMQGSFSASRDEITWVLTSYIVANGIMIPLTAWISARFGRKRYFMFSALVFVVTSGLCGAAGSLPQMVLFRLLQGAAGAAMIPSSQAIMMETFPPQERGLAMSIWGIGLLTSPMLGPTVGGWITYNWNWRWNFYINLPIGAFAVLMVSLFVHDPEHIRQSQSAARKVDYIGIVYLALGLGLLQICLIGDNAPIGLRPHGSVSSLQSLRSLCFCWWFVSCVSQNQSWIYAFSRSGSSMSRS